MAMAPPVDVIPRVAEFPPASAAPPSPEASADAPDLLLVQAKRLAKATARRTTKIDPGLSAASLIMSFSLRGTYEVPLSSWTTLIHRREQLPPSFYLMPKRQRRCLPTETSLSDQAPMRGFCALDVLVDTCGNEDRCTQ